MSRKIRAWATNLLLMTTAILVTLAAFEVALRYSLPQKLYRFPRGLFSNRTDRVYGLSPGFRGVIRNPEYQTHIRINSLGFRGGDVGLKGPQVFRIVVLGDSFVSAFNVEEEQAFASLLGDDLNTPPGGAWRVDVVNAGTPGYGTWHELRTLESLIPLLRPDLALLCVYVGNDLQDNLAPGAAVVQGGLLVSRKKSEGILPYPLRSWLQRHSMSYVFFWNVWDRIRPLFGLRAVDPLEHLKAIVSRKPDAGVEEAFRISEDLVGQVARRARESRLPLLLVLIPAEQQVYPESFVRELQAQGLGPSDFDVDLPSRKWREMAEKLRLPVLDLLPVFRSRVRGPHLYMSLDGHLSVPGNRLAGEAIRDAVRSFLAPHGDVP